MSWDLPQSIKISGTDYKIDADFRTILKINKELCNTSDPEVIRALTALAMFYEDFDSITDYQQAFNKMIQFINCGQDMSQYQNKPKVIDWEQDEQYIIADINKAAGQEVRALPFVHWWTFVSWFNSIGEGQLSTIVSIREKRRKGKKLSDWEREFYRENRSKIDLKQKYTQEEMEGFEQFANLLRG